MLSSGTYYKHVPKPIEQNLIYRKYIYQRCETDREFRAAIVEICKRDILFYVNTFVWQFNPDNLDHEVEPFITYDFQEHAILGGDVVVDGVETHRWGILECIEDQKDARWPKSRKMGASWVALMCCDWLCMFHDRKSVGVLSRDEPSVDQSGDPNSLFWKIEFMHEHLPDFLKGKITKRKMRFNYERTNSYMIGEANTPSAFVSGRATIILIDEFGQFKNGAETFEMTSDVSYCRVFVFTHKEQSGMAYDLCFDAKYTGMREIKTHWTQHPERNRGLYRYVDEQNRIEILDKLFEYPENFKFVYDIKPVGGPYPGLRSPWYDEECRRRSERDVAMNLDIDPRGASDKFFDAYRIQLLKAEFCAPPVWRGTLKYDRDTGKPIELVYDPEGILKLWVHPKSPRDMPLLRVGSGCDVSAGSGATPSCFMGYDADTGHKILEYVNALIFANQFAELVVSMCRLMPDRHGNLPLLGWELTGGQVFGRRVRELGYFNVYIRADEDALGNPRDNKGRPGVLTEKKAALPVMNNYRDALYERKCINYSEEALNETLRMVYSKGGVEYRGTQKPKKYGDEGSGATIHHGDLVTADAIAWKMCEELGVEERVVKESSIPRGSLAWRRARAHNREESLV